VSDQQGPDRAETDRDDDVLPEQTSDDTDRGWGERDDDELSDDERLIREKPPHW
jgi:hypothetical protein